MPQVMDRREFLSRSLWGAIPLTLAGSTVWGQQPAQRGPAVNGPQAAAPPQQQVPQQQEVPQPNPQVVAILRNWEISSGGFSKLEGAFERYVYDDVFGVEKRSVGEFQYQQPDKGRLDFRVPKEVPATNPGRKTKTGAPFKVVADTPQRWVCTGKEVLIIDDQMKTVQKVSIPPQFQGQNIADGPLPFLFGMKAEKALQRYSLTIGAKHSPQVYHLVAKPLFRQDAQEWQVAEVMLNPANFMPRAIRTIDPAGTRDTVYVFQQEAMKQDPRWIFSPFEVTSLGLRGYNVIQETTAEAPPESKPAPKSIIK